MSRDFSPSMCHLKIYSTFIGRPLESANSVFEVLDTTYLIA